MSWNEGIRIKDEKLKQMELQKSFESAELEHKFLLPIEGGSVYLI
jgi:hypothetical protein